MTTFVILGVNYIIFLLLNVSIFNLKPLDLLLPNIYHNQFLTVVLLALINPLYLSNSICYLFYTSYIVSIKLDACNRFLCVPVSNQAKPLSNRFTFIETTFLSNSNIPYTFTSFTRYLNISHLFLILLPG